MARSSGDDSVTSLTSRREDIPRFSATLNACQSINGSVSRSVGSRSVGQSDRPTDRQSVSPSVGRSVGQSVSRSVGQSVSRSVGQSVSRSVGQSVSRSVVTVRKLTKPTFLIDSS